MYKKKFIDFFPFLVSPLGVFFFLFLSYMEIRGKQTLFVVYFNSYIYVREGKHILRGPSVG